VQDLGRWGHQDAGVPVAGAMDTQSLRWANALAGNASTAAGLEITLIGPTLRARGAGVRASVTGATFDLWVDDAPAPMDRAFDVPDGATVRFGARRSGARAYLAVTGGIDTPPVLGSRSTHLVSRMGGLDGRAIAAGDRLPIGPRRHDAGTRRLGPAPTRALPRPVVLRVLLGPQDTWFARTTVDALVTAPFTVSASSDRMGYRLEGPRLETGRQEQMLSEPVAFGALQVPSSGAPILLMADRQTAGGYPKIATVIAADLPLAGQLAPGDVIRFAACSRHDAMAALIAAERAWLRAAGLEEPR
jgi:antagonist of KipI